MPDLISKDNSPTRAEQYFQQYVDLVRQGASPDTKEFVRLVPAKEQECVTWMIENYQQFSRTLKSRSPEFEEGTTLGVFQLVKCLGKGGSAVVWEAHERTLDRQVALKILSPLLSFSPNALRRFCREARAGGRLAHAGIIRTYHTGEVEGFHYIAQELVEDGRTLADLIQQWKAQGGLQPNDYRLLARIFVEITAAMAHAHKAGVVHRDIKPSNILLTPDNRPLVADFGLARIEDDLAISRSGECLGTYAYLSPEQTMPKCYRLDHRTDIFSLGATLFECLTLERAFEGDSQFEILEKIAHDNPPDARQLNAGVPRDLAVICGCMLEKSRARRYQTMACCASDLRRFLKNLPIKASPPNVATRVLSWTKRHQTLMASSGTAAATLLLARFLFPAAAMGGEESPLPPVQTEQEPGALATQRERGGSREILQPSHASFPPAALASTGSADESDSDSDSDSVDGGDQFVKGKTQPASSKKSDSTQRRDLNETDHPGKALGDQNHSKAERTGAENPPTPQHNLDPPRDVESGPGQLSKPSAESSGENGGKPGQNKAGRNLDLRHRMQSAESGEFAPHDSELDEAPSGKRENASVPGGGGSDDPPEAPPRTPTAKVIKADSGIAAQGFESGVIEIVDAYTGLALNQLADGSSAVIALVFSTDGPWIQAISSDQYLRVWNYETGELLERKSLIARLMPKESEDHGNLYESY